MSNATIETPRTTEPLTHSRLACFRACPRKAQLSYEYRLKPIYTDLPMRVGSAFARAVEAHAKGLDVEAAMGDGLADPYDLALVAAMFTTHVARWEGHGLEHVHAELEFHDVPIVNPETGRATSVYGSDGKIDRIVRLPDGRLAIMEYKTTSKDFAPGSDYWLRLHIDLQLSIYLLAARHLGIDVSTILYDVTRRPALQPKQVPILDADGLKIVRDATGARVRNKDKSGSWRQSASSADGYVMETRPETPDEYGARCVESMQADPDKHFARIEVARTDADLDDARAEIWQQQLAHREAQRSGRWYRNPEACFGVNTRCAYVDICRSRGLDQFTPEGFQRVANAHSELSVDATAGG